MELHEFESRFEKTINAFREVGESYAECKAQSWHLQELRKVILANQMTKLEGSESSKERQALCSEEYRIHLNGTRQAIENELKLRAKMEKLQYQIEAYRSLSSLAKKQMNML